MIFTVDLEEYFHANIYDGVIDKNSMPSSIERQTENLLAFLASQNQLATFFVLGSVAEKFPDLIQRIAAQGHEIACHGYSHCYVSQQSPEEFRDDTYRSKSLLEDIAGHDVLGYRAASFSIEQSNIDWAMDCLVELGFRYDASIFPIKHDHYGYENFPQGISRIETSAGSILEIPGTVYSTFKRGIGFAGGAWLRFLPMHFLKAALDQNKDFFVVYIHPWEFDTKIEDAAKFLSAKKRFRHCYGRASLETKLAYMIENFDLGSIESRFIELGELAVPLPD